MGEPEKLSDGWWRVPLELTDKPVSDELNTAWHGTRMSCLYSILYHEQLVGDVYCYGEPCAVNAQTYMVFENVFGNGAWWASLPTTGAEIKRILLLLTCKQRDH